MRHLAPLFIVASALLCAPVHADNTDAVSKAKSAAEQWLASADAGQYDKNWEESASAFKKAVTKAQWENGLKSVRSPLGPLKSRTVAAADYTQSLPGAPKGEYVVIRYTSEYANKTGVVETVTPMLDADGTWRVSGYFVKR